MAEELKCSCENPKRGLPFCFGPPAPDFYVGIPEAERAKRSLLDTDLCVIDKEHHFIRGCLDIPIIGTQDVFRWLVWVSLSEKNFNRAVDVWETPGRESEPPYFGWLSTSLPHYPETLNLKTNVHTRPVGERPRIELEPTSHPLAVEQRQGIPLARAQSLASHVLQEWS
ncbi:MAG TPA: DUF2199 domain-containing protein [Verrucomicrobiota bacterium]|jgi:hypothetical protein|nr:DUF2199 domain-containing protein [Verrucomicrobiota bacterium]HQB18016.1 DUF2199 domain-containing protein [Verrucomicrobiota bacterium]